MSDEPINLDDQRGIAAQRATEDRRLRAGFEASETDLRARQAVLEEQLLSAPASTWAEAAGKARYLINLLSNSPAGLDPRRQKLIKAVLDDFDSLSRDVP